MSDRETKILVAALVFASLLAAAIKLWPFVAPVPPAAKVAETTVKVTSFLPFAINLYSQHVGEYPASLVDLTDRPRFEPGVSKWLGPYVKKNSDVLKDAWGEPLRYERSGQPAPSTYRLWSIGADGVDGTADDIVYVLPPVAPVAPQPSQPASRPDSEP